MFELDPTGSPGQKNRLAGFAHAQSTASATSERRATPPYLLVLLRIGVALIWKAMRREWGGGGGSEHARSTVRRHQAHMGIAPYFKEDAFGPSENSRISKMLVYHAGRANCLRSENQTR